MRLLLHALDRTGPPMLARATAGWLHEHVPGIELDVVAFRGGPMLDDMVGLGPVTVLLDPSEPWDHDHPDPARRDEVLARAEHLDDVDLQLAVSVAAGECLPYLPPCDGPLVTWCVEQGPNLHWIDAGVGLRERTTLWLAGSAGIAVELGARLGTSSPPVVPEFVPGPDPAAAALGHCRTTMSAGASGLVVVGAGIATERKAPDLFIELAAEARRRGRTEDRFVWFGGEHDPMLASLLDEVRRLGLRSVRFLGNVDDIEPWLAAADVLVHPARLDAFPLVCLHAALGGTPVVGFAGVGGLQEMFGEHALTRPYPDLPGLWDLVEQLRDPRQRRRAARAQRDRVLDRYTADAAAPALWTRLEPLIGRA